MDLDDLMAEMEKISDPNAYSQKWLDVFAELGISESKEAIKILKEELQLYFL